MKKIIQFFTIALVVLFSTSLSAQYCTPAYTTACGFGGFAAITKATIGSYSKSTTTCVGYDTSGIASSAVTLYTGFSYTISATCAYGVKFGVWIDKNQNKDFGDPGEFIGGNSANATSYTGSLNIPANATPGVYRIRFRTGSQNGGNATAFDSSRSCTSYQYGEAEDYLITVKKSFTVSTGVVELVSPAGGACGDSNMKVTVKVRNFGTSAVSTIPVTLFMNDGSVITKYSQTFNRTLSSGSTDTFSFSKTLNGYNGGTYGCLGYTTTANDSDNTDDTLITKVGVFAGIPAPTAKDGFMCSQSGSMRLYVTNNPGYQTFWFDAPKGGTIVSTDDTFNIPQITSSKVYYATYTTAQRFPGGLYPKDNSSWTGGMTTSQGQATVFTAMTDFTLDSVSLYPAASGNVVINLTDATGTTLKTATIAVTYNASSPKVEVPLGWFIKKGTGYRLNNTGTTIQMYRNTSGTNIYPINGSTGVVSITGNVNGGGPYYYYWYYNWKITSSGCYSPRTPVKATVGKIDSGANIDSMASAFNGKYGTGGDTMPDSVCSGESITYKITPSAIFTNSDYGKKWSISNVSFRNVASGFYSNEFTQTNPTSTAAGTITFSPTSVAADSTYIMKVTIGTIGGCDSTFIRYIYVNTRPKTNFTVATVCQENTSIFTNTSVQGKGWTTYTWDFGDGTKSTVDHPRHLYMKGGLYKVLLKAENSVGCWDTSSQMVAVNAKPVAKFFNYGACNGSASQFIDSSKIDLGYVASHTWDFGDGTYSSATNPTHTYTTTGNFTVKQIATSDKGCTDTVSMVITVNSLPSALFSASSGCSNDSIAFSNSSTTPTGSLRFEWTFGDGFTSTLVTPKHVYKKGGTFSVQLVAISDKGCRDSITKSITVNPKPVAAFGACNLYAASPADFTDSSTIGSGGNIISYDWDFGDGATSSTQNPKHTFAKAGTYNVTLTSTSDKGCVGTITKTLSVLPTITFTTKAIGSMNYKFTIGDSTQSSYLWDFGDGAKSTFPNPTHLYTIEGPMKVTVTIKNKLGCTYTHDSTITVVKSGISEFLSKDFNVSVSPNPFTENANIQLLLTRNSKVKIEVTDIAGRVISEITNSNLHAGNYNFNWNGALENGLYFIKTSVNNQTTSLRVIQLK